MSIKRKIYALFFAAVFAPALLFAGDFELIRETDTLSLFFDPENLSLMVRDRRNGQEWYSCFNGESYRGVESSDFWMDRFNSLFDITYTDLTLESNKTKTVSQQRLDAQCDIHTTDKGIKLDFLIDELKISFTLLISIDEDRLILAIPDDSVKETVGTGELIEKTVETLHRNLEGMTAEFEAAKDAGRFSEIEEEVDDITYDMRIFKEALDSIDGVNNLEYRADDAYFYMLDIRRKLKGYQGQRNVLGELDKLGENRAAKDALSHYGSMYKLTTGLLAGIGTLKEIVSAGIVSIDPIPFFGAAGDHEDGYVFYPDGSGAITIFKEDHPQWNEYYHKDIYSPDGIDFDQYEFEKKNGLKDIHLPVYGIKKSRGGLLGVVSEGASMTSINYYPSGYQIDMNRAGVSFRYRREYDAAGSAHNVNSEGYERASRSGIIQKERIGGDKEISYVFLDRQNSDYSGMANRYREILLNEGRLNNSSGNYNAMPLAVDFLGGIMENRILFNRFISMTDFQQIGLILSEMSQWGVKELDAGLIGWMKNGHLNFPAELVADRRLGGNEGLKALQDQVSALGYRLFLYSNFVDADKEQGGFSIYSDVIRGRNQIQESDLTGNLFAFNPRIIEGRYEEYREISEKLWTGTGILMDRIGSYLYFDENRDNLISRSETEGVFSAMVEDWSDKGLQVALYSPNAYALADIDRLYDVPVDSTGYFYTDRSIPFYQMVVHGSIPYSSTPFNLFYDKRYEKLKAVEYGVIPYFFLTEKDAEELKYTDFSQLFSPAYRDWKEEIHGVWKEFDSRLNGIWNRYMVKHEVLDDGLVSVTYDNGTRILINYGEEPVEHEGLIIDALDYKVVGSRGVIK